LLRHVIPKRKPNISKEYTATIFGVEEGGKQETSKNQPADFDPEDRGNMVQSIWGFCAYYAALLSNYTTSTVLAYVCTGCPDERYPK
jgi:hypothetical protein